MYQPTRGGRISANAVQAMTQQTTVQSPITYESGNTKSTKITKTKPLVRLQCALHGGVTWSAAATLARGGMLNLLQRLELRMNGDNSLFNLRGRDLIDLSTIFNNGRNAPRTQAPLLTTGGNRTFRYPFEVVMDVGGYTSLLDASQAQDLELDVTWGTAADCVTAGTSSALTDVQLDVLSYQIAGGIDRQEGGRFYPYAVHKQHHISLPITAVQTDLRFDLTRNRFYDGFVIQAETTNGVPSDAILNSITAKIGNVLVKKLTADELRDHTQNRYGIDQVGTYVFDMGDREHFEQAMGIDANLDMFLEFDVANPGTDKLHVTQNYLVAARQRQTA